MLMEVHSTTVDYRLARQIRSFWEYPRIPWLLTQLLRESTPRHPDVDDMISLHQREWGQPVFTHRDLSSLNILVRRDDILGLVD